MSTLYEGKHMVDNSMTKKEMVWNISGTEYKVLNVPTYNVNSNEDESFDMDVTMKLSLIRELMYTNEIPHIANFDF